MAYRDDFVCANIELPKVCSVIVIEKIVCNAKDLLHNGVLANIVSSFELSEHTLSAWLRVLYAFRLPNTHQLPIGFAV